MREASTIAGGTRCLGQGPGLRRDMLGLSRHVLPDQATPAHPRPFRTSATLRSIQRYLEAATEDELPKLLLALGAGLSAGQIDGLRGRDLVVVRPSEHERRYLKLPPRKGIFFFVRTGASGGGERWHPLPPWVVDILRTTGFGVGDWPLFSDAPGILQTMRRLRRELPEVEQITPADLVLTWQAIARHAGLPRDIVRRTWSQPADGPHAWPARHDRHLGLLRFARRWRTLSCPLTEGFVDASHIVPRKAPRGCPPDQPEVDWPRPRERAPLPRSLQIP